ncbi:GyrI-like domain-containing protein [Tunicatimonas pelagia]|uniref:GyrI-like domain-containing protein n=1 Tax=Tunicatimonas pelagia TaxID=931531 RepID=UPI0026662640|nr:GyrI-like domain-containing protein [Tunicatimonas pelagia]WKN45916.1 GyrI-like domain-containing protein [Tunicatimonas pelagia]
MKSRIEIIEEIKLVGKKVRMSVANNQTQELWQGFMPNRATIKNTIGTALYSVEVYDNLDFFEQFSPTQEFDKWAAVQVRNYESVSEDMEQLMIPAGLYAVFLYQGKASEAITAYQYIYGNWIPNSDYNLDDRPHFALMGEKYKNDDPTSEEEFWIPVVAKT